MHLHLLAEINEKKCMGLLVLNTFANFINVDGLAVSVM